MAVVINKQLKTQPTTLRRERLTKQPPPGKRPKQQRMRSALGMKQADEK